MLIRTMHVPWIGDDETDKGTDGWTSKRQASSREIDRRTDLQINKPPSQTCFNLYSLNKTSATHLMPDCHHTQRWSTTVYEIM